MMIIRIIRHEMVVSQRVSQRKRVMAADARQRQGWAQDAAKIRAAKPRQPREIWVTRI